MVAPSLKKGFI